MVKIFSFFQFLGIIALLLICGFSMKKITQAHELLSKRNTSLAKENEELKSLVQEAEKNALKTSENNEEMEKYKKQLADFSANNAALTEKISQQENEIQLMKQVKPVSEVDCKSISSQKEELQKKYNYLLNRLSDAVKAKKIAPL